MKAVLVFKLPDERDEFETAQNGGLHLSLLDEIHNYCRGQLKHNEKISKSTQLVLEHILEIISEAKL